METKQGWGPIYSCDSGVFKYQDVLCTLYALIHDMKYLVLMFDYDREVLILFKYIHREQVIASNVFLKLYVH